MFSCFIHLTPRITGSKKQSEERAALFAVRVHVIVMSLHYKQNESFFAQYHHKHK